MGSKKDFTFYWNTIRWAFFALLAWGIAKKFVKTDQFAVFELVLTTGLLLLIGNDVMIRKKEHAVTAGWAGATLGMLYSFAYAVIDLLAFYIQPSMMQNKTEALLYISLVLSPIINALVGAVIAMLGGWLSKVALTAAGRIMKIRKKNSNKQL